MADGPSRLLARLSPARVSEKTAPFFLWKERFVLGASDVDADHRSFIELANRVRAAILAGNGPAVARLALARMADHARAHFDHEERCLVRSACPHLAEHLEEHRQFTLALSQLEAEPSPSPERIFCLTRDWILDHILGMDRRHQPWIALGAR
ncbi:MAG TPA: hemerythrin family protein [Candidatus Limnocylindrales bacterium]